MTDRELLELAAKAAGIERHWFHWELTGDWGMINDEPDCGLWNPLTNDGDALRLAVKLKIPLQFPDWADVAKAWGLKYADRPCDEPFDNDPYAATRRAIVRAAAEIGRSMKDE